MREWLDIVVGRDLTLRHVGWLSAAAALALSLLGVYAIDLAAAPRPAEGSLLPITPAGLVLKQIIFVVVGIAAAAAVVAPHYRLVRFIAWPAMWVCLGLLIFLLIPMVPHWIVRPRNGARAWINLGPIVFQPTEVAKIAFIMVVADYLRYRKNHRTFLGLIPIGLITFVPVGLIMLQPDLGSATLFIPTVFAMLVAAGARLRHLVAIVLIAMCAAPAAYPLLKPHQKQRIIGLLRMVQGSDEGADDINYQSLTARTLVGAGGLTGNPQEKARSLVRYNRLPERHNDMIFSVVVLRFGLLGAVATLGLYAMWIAGALGTAAACKDPFGRLVAVGCAAIVAAQLFINVGMNVGVLPIIGLTLPFISYGGSSMLTVWIMTGLIVNIAMRRPARLARPTFEFDDDEDEWA
jgi:cell division protein FtsW (lipid II flippase)